MHWRKFVCVFVFCVASVASAAVVDVASFATSGSGTEVSPYTGWDTAITWQARTEYHFKTGVYSYSTCPGWGLAGIRIIGEGSATILSHTGTGNAVCFDAGSSSTWIFGIQAGNFRVRGNANTTNGIFARGIAHSHFNDILVTDTTAAGVRLEACVLNEWDTIRISGNEGLSTRQPVNGWYLTRRGTGAEITTTQKITNTAVDQTTGYGIVLDYGSGNVFTGGSSEANGGGIQIAAPALGNTIMGMDFEANSGADIDVAGSSNVFLNNFLAGPTTSTISGSFNQILGGITDGLSISSGASHNSVMFVRIGQQGHGITDNGTSTTNMNNTDVTTSTTLGMKFATPYAVTVPASVDVFGITHGPYESIERSITVRGPIATDLSATPYATSVPWRIIFLGSWYSAWNGATIAMPAPYVEVTSDAPTFTVGGITVTVSQTTGGKFQIQANQDGAGFDGTISIVSGRVTNAIGGTSMQVKHAVNAGSFVATGAAPTVASDQIGYGGTTATSATSGSASALPATPAGYVIINVNGTTRKVPYYN
ncbi:MAG TPA: hypothetical protein VJZ00_02725 [Thermoanaerobaculia bacterium]|nr:hypothetical protein [Thermoanaerobaculia bacterium]